MPQWKVTHSWCKNAEFSVSFLFSDMESLPQEILNIVFSQLGPHEWLECVHVSRSWRAMAPKAVSGFWHDLVIDESDEAIMRRLSSTKFFRSLTCFRLSSTWPLKALMPGQVKKLDISMHSIAKAERLLAPHTPYLESLSIEYCGIYDFHFPSVLHACTDALSTFRVTVDSRFLDIYPYDIPMGSMDPPIGYQFLSITFIELTMTLPKNGMRTLLSRCPQLLVLKLTDQAPHQRLHRLHLHEILTLCPNLTHMAYVTGCINSSASWSGYIPPEFDWSPSIVNDHKQPASMQQGANGNTRHRLRWLYADDECALYDPAMESLCKTVYGLHIDTTEVDYQLGSGTLRVFSCGSAHAPQKLAEVLQNSPQLSDIRIGHNTNPLILVDPGVLTAAARRRHPHGVRFISLPLYRKRLMHVVRFLVPFRDALERLDLQCPMGRPRVMTGRQEQTTQVKLESPYVAVTAPREERINWKYPKDVDPSGRLDSA
ncbi:hypothetical protein BX666DRAFT_1134648 [Dichotomocladium elegans]|nr:hypothetical protein BX666DRAFT_1134648 [Dichotomocladium elegans]